MRLQLPSVPRLQSQAQCRARLRWSRQPARHAEPVRLRAACRPRLHLRPLRQCRDPAQFLRHAAVPDGVLLLPKLDGPARDDAQETPAAGGDPRSPVTQHNRSQPPGRLPQSAAVALRLDKRQAAQTTGRPLHAAPTSASTIASGIASPHALPVDSTTKEQSEAFTIGTSDYS